METSASSDSGTRTVSILGKNRQRPALAEGISATLDELRGTESPTVVPSVPLPPLPKFDDELPLDTLDGASTSSSIAEFEPRIESEPPTRISERSPSSSPVGTETSGKAAAKVAEAVPLALRETCPNCSGKLVSPEDLGWCMSCGYCRSTAESAPKVAAPEATAVKKPSALGMVECYQLMTQIPAWAWLFCSSIGLMVLLSLAADDRLAAASRRGRSGPRRRSP